MKIEKLLRPANLHLIMYKMHAGIKCNEINKWVQQNKSFKIKLGWNMKKIYLFYWLFSISDILFNNTEIFVKNFFSLQEHFFILWLLKL